MNITTITQSRKISQYIVRLFEEDYQKEASLKEEQRLEVLNINTRII